MTSTMEESTAVTLEDLPPKLPAVIPGGDEDLSSCPIVPGRETTIEIAKEKSGLGLSIVGGSDTLLVRFCMLISVLVCMRESVFGTGVCETVFHTRLCLD